MFQRLVGIAALRAAIGLTLCVLACAAASVEPGPVRESALAGTWYPADPAELKKLVDSFLGSSPARQLDQPIRALIVPHAGYAYSGPVAARAFALLRGQSPRRVVILAPSHHSGFQGISVAEVSAYRTPLGEIPLDQSAVARLRGSPLWTAEPKAHEREHSIEIELPLLQRALTPGWELVPVLVGVLDNDQYLQAAELLKPLANAETLVVVSSDFTHYGERFDYLPFPVDDKAPARVRELDEWAIGQIRAKSPQGFFDYQESTGITVCGYRAIAILLSMLGPQASVESVAYDTSGDLTGDWTSSVSYAALAITDPVPLAEDKPKGSSSPATNPAAAQPQAAAPLSSDELRQLHWLATLAIEDAVLGPSESRSRAKSSAVDSLPPRLKEPAGAFVTLKRHGELRGCIGYIEPRTPLYLAVLANGDNAARRDPRFDPMSAPELEGLEIEVSVLAPLRPVDSWESFRVGKEGVVLTKDGRSAVFLPEVATEQGWTREETLSHLSLKAGLPANAWRDGASFEVFESYKYAAPYRAARSSD